MKQRMIPSIKVRKGEFEISCKREKVVKNIVKGSDGRKKTIRKVKKCTQTMASSFNLTAFVSLPTPVTISSSLQPEQLSNNGRSSAQP